jgi:hypothetical protein
MGRTDLNVKIGNESFYSLPIVFPNDTNICDQNCVLIKEECSSLFVKSLAFLLGLIGYGDKLQCPLE